MGDIIKIGKRNGALIVYQVSSSLTQELLNEMNQVADQGKFTEAVQSEIKSEQKHMLHSMREYTSVFTQKPGQEGKKPNGKVTECCCVRAVLSRLQFNTGIELPFWPRVLLCLTSGYGNKADKGAL